MQHNLFQESLGTLNSRPSQPRRDRRPPHHSEVERVSPSKPARKPGSDALYLGHTDRVGYLAAGVGAVIQELSLRRASLEEAFMELTADSVQYSASGQLDRAIPEHEFAFAAAGK